jgi:hypothetical protein
MTGGVGTGDVQRGADCLGRRDPATLAGTPRIDESMAGQVEKALLSFAARWRSPKRRAAFLVLFGWVLLAQTLLVVHRIDHNATEHGVACALCVAADHLAGGAQTHVYAIDAPEPLAVESTVGVPAARTIVVAHRSRAPPELLAA